MASEDNGDTPLFREECPKTGILSKERLIIGAYGNASYKCYLIK
jgi:hypothetical protein